MRQHWIPACVVLLLSAGCAAAQSALPQGEGGAPAAAANGAGASAPAAGGGGGGGGNASAPLTQDSSIDQILQALDQRGKDLKDFTAAVSLKDTDQAQGSSNTLQGQIWMQRLPGGDARLRVVFNTKQVNDAKPVNDKQEYALAGGWLIDRNYPDRKEVRRQVLRPGQKMDLLKLGEGPFPLPLGQDPAEVQRMFEVKKMPRGADDPPGTIHAQLVPKPGTQFADKFASIDVWVDPQSKFPVRIATLDPNGTTLRTTELKDIKVNVGLGDADFALPQIDEKSWSMQSAPFEQ